MDPCGKIFGERDRQTEQGKRETNALVLLATVRVGSLLPLPGNDHESSFRLQLVFVLSRRGVGTGVG